jgi:adenosylcobinamide-GDP ribazoletransferase
VVKVAALAALAAGPADGMATGALIAAHAGSRAVLPWIMCRLPLARPDGLAATVGTPAAATAGWSLGLGLVAVLLAAGWWAGLAAALAAVAVAWLGAQVARRQIGGYTGDVLGAVQQAVEAVILLAAASRL